MASELRFAIRCGSRQRSAGKTRGSAGNTGISCSRCSSLTSIRKSKFCQSLAANEETTYVPNVEIPWLTGVSREIVEPIQLAPVHY